MSIKVDLSLYEICPGSYPDSDDHTCPLLIYRNNEGISAHPACEGERQEWGEIIGIELVHR
jgi:hypothetical protein